MISILYPVKKIIADLSDNLFLDSFLSNFIKIREI